MASSMLRDMKDEDDAKVQAAGTGVVSEDTGFPTTRQLACTIRGKAFEFMVQSFADKVFVIITQKGRIGQMVSASMVKSRITGKVQFNMHTLLGLVDDFDLVNLLTRHLIQEVATRTGKSLVVGVGFDKSIGNEFAPLILKCVEQIRLW